MKKLFAFFRRGRIYSSDEINRLFKKHVPKEKRKNLLE